ncbi:hypothetical protein DL96DRAFT_272598 [Flagelloscypha sp. PMI_526]|nr:hypothetical protein DL96DRAFT_272598 [Flagelloscypha sp. PMI_526]
MSNFSGNPFATLQWPHKLTPQGQPSFAANLTFWNSSSMERYANKALDDEFHQFLQAYCVNPPNDTCDFPGRCINGDAAGKLVRAAAYLSVFFLGNLLHFDEGGIQESFTTHLLYVYSILISAAVSMGKQSLTRFHTEIIAMLLGSPLTFALFVYAILGTFGHKHSTGLNGILGPGRKTIIYRLLALSAFILWLAGLIYIEDPRNHKKFAQWACDPRTRASLLYYLSALPYMSVLLVIYWGLESPFTRYWLYYTIPVAVYVVAVIASIFFAWKELFHRKATMGKGIWWRIWHKWVVLRERFPFMHWMGIHVLPIMYWIFVTEILIYLDSDGRYGHDNEFELTFSQILAISVILKPLWANIMLLFSTREDGRNRLIFWFTNLHWIQPVTRRLPMFQKAQARKIMILGHHDYETSQASASLMEESSRNRDLEWK